jgi:hypothetical protein
MDKYWKVKEYSINDKEPRYPLSVIVNCGNETIDRFWRLPIDQLHDEGYDWTNAVKVEKVI